MRSPKLFIPKGIGELCDHLSVMMLTSPTFTDITGYFPYQNLERAFAELNEGLRRIRIRLGEARYLELRDMSDRMRAHFEADPEDKTGDAHKGCKLINEMRDLLKQSSLMP